jgi:hypothetical protein
MYTRRAEIRECDGEEEEKKKRRMEKKREEVLFCSPPSSSSSHPCFNTLISLFHR